MFVGREKELTKLNELYQTEKFQFVVLYGRRRIGKTTLINEFIKNKSVLYFTGVEESEKDNLARFSRMIAHFVDPTSKVTPNFNSFDGALARIGELGREEQLVFVIDEYPYLAQSYPAISSLLQATIDKEYLHSKIFLILCGSSMSFMENQVLGYQSPLYGRRTAQMKLNPFTFNETSAYLPKMDNEERFSLHAITGGIPQYLSFMSENITLKENISRTFLSTDGPLFEEPNNLLKQELREPANYNSIIKAIATGSSKQNEIATKTGIKPTSLNKYLKNLMDLGIVEKVIPITEIDHPKPKRTLYRIADGMFRFWFTFLMNDIEIIERGQGELLWKKIKEHFPDFLGYSFEQLAIDYLWNHILDEQIVPTPFQRMGTWWGTDQLEKKEMEIDIVGFNHSQTTGFFGECKWRNEAVDKSVLETLIYRSESFPYLNKELYLFSKNGFTKECEKMASSVGCHLISFDEMC